MEGRMDERIRSSPGSKGPVKAQLLTPHECASLTDILPVGGSTVGVRHILNNVGIGWYTTVYDEPDPEQVCDIYAVKMEVQTLTQPRPSPRQSRFA